MNSIRNYGSGGRYPNKHQSETAAVKRAMLEMGFNPGNELRLPPEEILNEKGMTQDDFMDAVYERAGDLYTPPMETIGAGRIDSGHGEPGLMYDNGGRLRDRMRQRREKRQMRRYLEDNMRRRDPGGERAGADVLLESLGEYGPDSISDMQEGRRQNRRDYARAGKTMATIGGLGAAVSAAYGRIKRDRVNTPQSGEKINLRDILKELFYNEQ